MATRKLTAAEKRAAQVQNLTKLKYAGPAGTLREQLRSAVTTKEAAIKGARSQRRVIESSADSAIPALKKVYTDRSALADKLQALAGPETPGGIAAIESSAAASRLGESEKSALSSLILQKAGAAGGEAFGIQNARNQYDATKAGIRTKQSALASEAGTYAATVEQDIRDKEAARHHDIGQQTRSQRFTAGQNKLSRDAADRRAAKKTKAQAKKDAHVSPKDQGEFQDSVRSAAGAAGHAADLVRTQQITRADALQVLINGSPAQPGTPAHVDKKKYDKLIAAGRTSTEASTLARVDAVPGLPAVPPHDALAAQAALDIAIDGYLSKKTIDELHKRQYQAKPLGPTSAKTTTGGFVGGASPRRP